MFICIEDNDLLLKNTIFLKSKVLINYNNLFLRCF